MMDIKCAKMRNVEGRSLVQEEIIMPIHLEEVYQSDHKEEERATNFIHSLPVSKQEIQLVQVGMRKEEKKRIVDDNFAFIFFKMAGENETMDTFELQRVMSMVYRSKLGQCGKFNLGACRSMIASVDTARTGNITYVQFKRLWKRLLRWNRSFDMSDNNENGFIDEQELGIALGRVGIDLENSDVQAVMSKYQNRDYLIVLEDFLQICSRATAARSSFKENIRDGVTSLDTFFFEMCYI